MIAAVTDESFERDVLSSERTTIVEFWADWCPPCRALSPILEQLAAEHEEITILKINADENTRSAIAYHALALPVMKVFQSGQVVKTIVGAKPKPALEAELSPYLA